MRELSQVVATTSRADWGVYRLRRSRFQSELARGSLHPILQEDAMRSRQVAEIPKTYVVILDTGEELLASLKEFAETAHLAGSSFKAIGALSNVELGWFNWETKKYQTAVKLNEQVELLSLIGDVALQNGNPQVHAHLVVGRADGSAHGGHLLSATVRPTCELLITENPHHLQKQVDPESGIALIRI
jgi:uncharacterized protein